MRERGEGPGGLAGERVRVLVVATATLERMFFFGSGSKAEELPDRRFEIAARRRETETLCVCVCVASAHT